MNRAGCITARFRFFDGGYVMSQCRWEFHFLLSIENRQIVFAYCVQHAGVHCFHWNKARVRYEEVHESPEAIRDFFERANGSDYTPTERQASAFAALIDNFVCAYSRESKPRC